MTAVAQPPRSASSHRATARSSVVEEIAARRRSDILAQVAGSSRAKLLAAAAAAPAPRPLAWRLAAPGLHLIAELKRSSPSAGRIAA
ncbi:MAG TPA: hypothetical protein VKC59_03360, partial [Candidatus Limnocylindrales bacterium]|nr:hypothetical protein [Candidatus Limnocylindrales bacterium]